MEQGRNGGQQITRSTLGDWLRPLGPGLPGGLSSNDSSTVTADALDGAQSRYGHLWLMLLSTPMYQAVLYTCAKIGRVTQKLCRGRPRALWTLSRSHSGTCACGRQSTADLVAASSGFMLLTGIDWGWFALPCAAGL